MGQALFRKRNTYQTDPPNQTHRTYQTFEVRFQRAPISHSP